MSGLDFETLEKSRHSIFGLSKDLKLIYYNKAWIKFSKNNNGDPDIRNRFSIGSSLEKAISGTVQNFYIEHYKRIILEKKVWKHEYECSSTAKYRLFSQDAYPLKNQEGIVVVNSLKIEEKIKNTSSKISLNKSSLYIGLNGFINQCSNCRKTQRPLEPEVWDWVPALVENTFQNVSHTICSIFYDYYWKYRSKKSS